MWARISGESGHAGTLRAGYSSPSTDSTLEVLFHLAFGSLRCSEFTSTSSTFDPSVHPCVSDITLHSPDTLIFSLKCRPAVPIFLFRLDSPLSRFESLQKLILSKSGRHALPSSPLFITQ